MESQNLKSQENVSDDGSVEWANAANFVAKLGRTPPLFTAPIRALMLNESSDPKNASVASEFLVMRLLRSPTFKAIFYYTAMTFRSEQILSLAYVSSYDLIRLYKPSDLAGMVGLIFTYRKIKSLLSDFEVPEECVDLEEIKKRADLGIYLGLAIPKFGVLRSMHAAVLPMLAQNLFALEEPESMQSYREHLREKKLIFDLDYERDCWSTTSLHICARLLQQLGFGPNYATSFFQGMQTRLTNFAEGKLDDLRYPSIELWVDSLLQTGAAPTVPVIGHFYPLQKELHKLLYEVTCLKENGSKHNWLDKSKNEISPHATPQLYQEVLAELTKSDDVRRFMAENLPASLVDSLSDEEMAEIASGQFDEEEEF